MVSHDRDFLDRTTTHILAFEGEGKVQVYVGGYTDYAAQHVRPVALKMEKKKAVITEKVRAQDKLSYKEARELSLLPDEIEIATGKIKELELKLSDPSYFQKNSKSFEQTVLELQKARHDLEHKEERWLELLTKEEALGRG